MSLPKWPTIHCYAFVSILAVGLLSAAGDQSSEWPSSPRGSSSSTNNSTVCISPLSPGSLGQPEEPEWAAGADQSTVRASQVSAFARPSFYTIRIHLDPSKHKFTGQLMIALEIEPPESSEAGDGEQGEQGHRYLTLHAGLNLQIKRAFYVFSGRDNLQIPATKIGRQQELLSIDFHPNVITAGQGLLLVVYSGQVNQTDSYGLFVHHSQRKSANKPDKGEDAGLATQMQPVFARRLFPSWDEPQLKSRFSLIVVLPFRGYQCISNMPVKRKSISLSCNGEPLQEVEFHTTPAMSTYLLTLVVGRFDHIESITANNCRVRAYVYAPANSNQQQQQQQQQQSEPNWKKSAAQMALDVAVKTFDRLETLLGVRYPLSKFDMVALHEFKSGGMENWGASIFNENYLLYDPALLNSSAGRQPEQQLFGRNRARRLLVPLVVAHEVAHQWFGNLVTLQNWTYLWLNEGFAQHFMYELADHLYPGHHYWRLFIEDSRQPVMAEDELISSSRALEFEPPPLDGGQLAESSLSSLFDKITYDKGACVVHMLRSLMGPDQFYKGLQHYLLKHAYDSVSSAHLWQALEESTGRAERQLEAPMAGWLRLEGFPLLTLQVSDLGAHYELDWSQERFTLLQVAGNASQLDWKHWSWSVPVFLAAERRPAQPGRPDLVLVERQGVTRLAKSELGGWFKANANATGYFRVHYAPGPLDMLERLRPALRSKSLNGLDRFNLVDDLFALVRAGRRSTVYYLRFLTESLDEETEPMVLRAALASLRRVRGLVSNEPVKLMPAYDRYVRKYLERVSSSNGAGNWPPTSSVAAAAADGNELGRQAKEIEDLISATRLLFNDRGLAERAADAFSANFRQQSFDGLDRETRAAIYSAALAQAAQRDADLSEHFSLSDALRNVTSISANQTARVAQQGDLFMRLLLAYNSTEWSGQRAALSAALGSVGQPEKRRKLLHLALLDNYFRPADTSALLDAMARTRAGRRLIWTAAKTNLAQLVRRQLLQAVLESLSSNAFVEEPGDAVESQLRQLYQEYGQTHGKVISQTVELLLINSQWWRRDQQELSRFLLGQSGASV